jgi:hypothetical protein
MKHPFRFLLSAILLLAMSAPAAPAAETDAAASARALIETLALAPGARQALRASLDDPDTLNQALDALKEPAFGRDGKGLGGILSALNMRFKAFDTQGVAGGSALGLTYAYDKAMMGHELDRSAGYPLSLTVNLHAKGDVAFDAAKNPNDFLDTGASFNVFGSKDGFEPVADSAGWAARAQELIVASAKFTGTPEELDRSRQWLEFQRLVQQRLSTQYFWRVSGNLSLESNQDFTSRQSAYGLQVGGVIRAWNEESAWAQFNFLDWPFAALRYLTGADREFHPSGRAWPLVIGGIDQVNPEKNEVRLAADPDKSTYGRGRAEVSFKTRVARLSGKDLWFVANYRGYAEFSPSTAIRAARLNRFEYIALGLEFENGLGVTYSTGKLPLDQTANRVFDVGYRLKL